MALEAFCVPPLMALRPLTAAAVGRRGGSQASAFCPPRPTAAAIVHHSAVKGARLLVSASAGGPASDAPAASNGDPVVVAASNGDPVAAAASNGDPVAAAASNGDPVAAAASNGDPVAAAASNGDPVAAAASNGDPVAAAAEDDEEDDEGAVMSAPTEADAQLLSAAMDGELLAISAALEAGASPSATDSNGRTALHMVAANGLRQAIGDLLERGADINAADTEGLTPLHMATGYQRPDTVRALLAIGADPDLQSKVGDSAVELAEKVVGVTPEKVFWRRNAKYDTAVEVLGILEELYEYYDDEEAGGDGEGAATEGTEVTAAGASGNGTDVKFTVRKRVRAEEAGGEAVPAEAPPPSSSADVRTTVRVRKSQE